MKRENDDEHLTGSSEFDSTQLSQSCTGEMTLTVTRNSLLGLLGAPFDPMTVTVTAGGMCYVSVVFTPMEVIPLRDTPTQELNLARFRSVLWKLTGRAGYGFCPGFKDSDFPPGFEPQAHGLQVLTQPFRRLQSPACSVFRQQRRASSRPVAHRQPLHLHLCPSCFHTLTDIFVAFKGQGRDLSVAAFAKFLTFDSSSVSQPSRRSSPLSKAEEGGSGGALGGEEEVGDDGEGVEEEGGSPDAPGGLGVGWERSAAGKGAHVGNLTMRDCSVLLDRVLPSAKGNNCSPPSPLPPADRVGTAASSASSQPPSLTPSSPVNRCSARRGMPPAGGEGASQRPVLSARIKPFRTVEAGQGQGAGPWTERQGQGAGPWTERPGQGADPLAAAERGMMEGGEEAGGTVPLPPTQGCEASREMEGPGPPVLTPEVMSPDSSPQPLMIDEEGGMEVQGGVEPESKRPCLSCPQCEHTFPSQSQLHHHISHHHPGPPPAPASPLPPQAVRGEGRGPGEGGGGGGAAVRTCPVCQSAFRGKEELQSHLISRHGARLHPCRYCGQKFAQKSLLAHHLQRHRGRPSLLCKECGDSFSSKKRFAAHVRGHMGSLPYFCTICSRMFSREKVYQDHLARHRAGRGVHAVLEPGHRASHSAAARAHRCLEEKALFTPTVDQAPVSSQNSASPPVLSSLPVSSQNSASPPVLSSLPVSSQNSVSPPVLSSLPVSSQNSSSPSVLSSPPVSSQTPVPPSVQPSWCVAQSPAIQSSSESSVRQSSPSLHNPAAAAAGFSEPDSLASSNLLLLSAVSLARDSYDRAHGDPGDGKLPTHSSTADSRQATFSHRLSSAGVERGGQAAPSGAESRASGSGDGVASDKRPQSQVDLLLQQLHGPVPSRASPTASSSSTEHAPPSPSLAGVQKAGRQSPAPCVEDTPLSSPSTTPSLHNNTHSDMPSTSPQKTSHTKETEEKKQPAVVSPSADSSSSTGQKASPREGEEKEEKSGKEEQEEEQGERVVDKELREREERLRQKEEELRERERSITRKNIAFFQQLLLSHIASQSKSPNPLQGDKRPSHQQALAMLSAISGGRGGAPFRLPSPGTRTVPGGGHPPGSKAAAAALPASRAGAGVRPGEGAETRTAAGSSPQVAWTAAGGGRTHPTPPCAPTHPAPQAGPSGPSLSSFPKPHPACGVPTRSSSGSGSGSGPSQGGAPVFLRELMKLESKMPASAKVFLPPLLAPPPRPAPKASSAPSMHRTHLISPSSRRALTTHLREGTGAGHGGGGVALLSVGGGGGADEGARGRGKRGAWSGGLVKEKLTTVPTLVPLHEVQRLMSLTTPRSPLPRGSPSLSPRATPIPTPTPTPSPATATHSGSPSPLPSPSPQSSCPPTPSSSSSLPLPPSPAAPSSVSGSMSVTSPRPPTNPSPTASASTRSSPAHHTPRSSPAHPSPRPSTTTSTVSGPGLKSSVVVVVEEGNLPSMPPLIPASSLLEQADPSPSSGWPSPSPSSAKPVDADAEPMDLTKGGKKSAAAAAQGGARRSGTRSRGPVTSPQKGKTLHSASSSAAAAVSAEGSVRSWRPAGPGTELSEGRTPGLERDDHGVQATAQRSTPQSKVSQSLGGPGHHQGPPGQLPGGPGQLPGGPGQLPGGSSQLLLGPGQLPKGPGQLPKGPGHLPVGPGQLPGGSGQLHVGPGQLLLGPGQLPKGPGQLPKGPGHLPVGPGQLSGGPGQLPGGPGQLPGGPIMALASKRRRMIIEEGAERHAVPSVAVAVAQNGVGEAWAGTGMLRPEARALLQRLVFQRPSLVIRDGTQPPPVSPPFPHPTAMLQMIPSPPVLRPGPGGVEGSGVRMAVPPRTSGPRPPHPHPPLRLSSPPRLPMTSPVTRPPPAGVGSPSPRLLGSSSSSSAAAPSPAAVEVSGSAGARGGRSASHSHGATPQSALPSAPAVVAPPPRSATTAGGGVHNAQHASPSPLSRGGAKRRQAGRGGGGKEEEKVEEESVSPLGGFTWHRPAQPQRSSGGAAATTTSEGGGEEREGGGADSAEHNLWQQQFLATLREKRRQKQEQQQQQQQQQKGQHQAPPPLSSQAPPHSTHAPPPSSQAPPPSSQVPPPSSQAAGTSPEKQEAVGRRRRKRNSSQASTKRSQEDSAPGAQESSQNSVERARGNPPPPPPPPTIPAGQQQPPSPLSPPSSSQSRGQGSRTRRGAAAAAAVAGGRGGRGGGGRGRGRRKGGGGGPSAPSLQPVGGEEGGQELRGFGGDEGEVKVELLEAGVRCDDCGHVFFNETDILEHDCQGP